jgi:hypothetical protein
MKDVTYDELEDVLVIDGSYEARRFDWFEGYAAPFEQVADVSLVSFRNAAARYLESSYEKHLLLGWADYPTAVFDAGDPPLELVWLSSDGKTVAVRVDLFLRGRSYPEGEESVALLPHRSRA